MVKFGCHMVALGAWILGMTWQVAGEQLQCQEIRNEHFLGTSETLCGLIAGSAAANWQINMLTRFFFLKVLALRNT